MIAAPPDQRRRFPSLIDMLPPRSALPISSLILARRCCLSNIVPLGAKGPACGNVSLASWFRREHARERAAGGPAHMEGLRASGWNRRHHARSLGEFERPQESG